MIRKPFSELGDQVGQGCVGCLTISDHILRDCEFEKTITFVGFQLSFTESRFAITALGSDEYLPSMIGNRGRLQLNGLACSRVCLIQFSGIEKNASQVVLRKGRQRVEFRGLPRLSLGFIKSAKVNNDSRQQIVRGGICRGKFFGAL